MVGLATARMNHASDGGQPDRDHRWHRASALSSRVSVHQHRFRKHEARRGKTRRRHSLFNAMALAPGLALAEVACSVFCPLSPSRRLLLFASPALPAADARVAGRDSRRLSA